MNITTHIEASDPDVSVVIPTVPSRKIYSLDYLRDQTIDNYEVISVSGQDINNSEARNIGIDHVSAPIIAITDDDTKPPRDWLEMAVTRLRETESHLLQGPVTYLDVGSGGDRYRDCYRLYVGCNLAFRKKAWKTVGGFKSEYAGWGEDYAFGWDIEGKYGLENIEYSRQFRMIHIGWPKSTRDPVNEALVRREYPEQYFALWRDPKSGPGKVLIGLAQTLNEISPKLVDLLDQLNPR